MPDHLEPGRPAVEAVFVALAATAIPGIAAVHILARVLPPSAAGPPVAVPLTLTILFVSVAFAAAQAILPGPRSTGCFGLAIPISGAVALAFRGVEPAALVSALFVGVFLTPAAYYIAIRLSFWLRGLHRRRPLLTILAAAVGMLALLQAARLLTHLADRSVGWRSW